ncbi:MAG: hypothetical protein LC802_19170 [Acidobacteria bacterium]|nr:hypothetical protein [Acidobacteriota bacterium]
MAKLVTGLFKTRAAAEAGVDALIKRGYTRDDISVLMSDATRTKGIPEHRAKVYDASLRAGGILVGVEAKSDDEADKLEKLLEDLGAEHVRQE